MWNSRPVLVFPESPRILLPLKTTPARGSECLRLLARWRTQRNMAETSAGVRPSPETCDARRTGSKREEAGESVHQVRRVGYMALRALMVIVTSDPWSARDQQEVTKVNVWKEKMWSNQIFEKLKSNVRGVFFLKKERLSVSKVLINKKEGPSIRKRKQKTNYPEIVPHSIGLCVKRQYKSSFS